jgi:hypothetical protein
MTDFHFHCTQCHRTVEMSFEGSIDGGKAVRRIRTSLADTNAG